jgi:HEAT repeat protein
MRTLSLMLMLSVSTMASADSLDDKVAAICTDDVALCARLATTQPVRNRAGGLHFVGADLDREDASWVLLRRLLLGQDSEAIRAALVPACAPVLTQNTALSLRVLSSPSPRVRARLVGQLRGVSLKVAAPVLVVAAVDEDDRVREVTAMVMGYLEDAPAYRQILQKLSKDDSPAVRAMSARSVRFMDAQ